MEFNVDAALADHSCSCPGNMDRGSSFQSSPPSLSGSRKASLISEEDVIKQRLIQKQLRSFFQPAKSRRASLKAHQLLDLLEWQKRRPHKWMIHPRSKFRHVPSSTRPGEKLPTRTPL